MVAFHFFCLLKKNFAREDLHIMLNIWENGLGLFPVFIFVLCFPVKDLNTKNMGPRSKPAFILKLSARGSNTHWAAMAWSCPQPPFLTST